MSSYAGLYVHGAEVFTWRNEIDPTFLFLYTTSDVRRVPMDPDEIWDDDVTDRILLTSSASVLADRLDALGIGQAAVEKAFEQCVSEQLEISKDISLSRTVASAELLTEIQFLENLDFPRWVDALAPALKSADKEMTRGRGDPTSLAFLLNIWEYADPRLLLRAVLLSCDPEEEITLDVTDLIGGGWMEDDFDPQSAAIDHFSFALANGNPAVVITEGSTDARILQSAIRIRYRHLESFIKFFDFTTDAEGSAAAGVRTLKSFAAAGISNRVILLLDNDTAAKAALRGLRGVKLPDHYSVLQYPDIEIGRAYPTLGPNGLSDMDVNGFAGSIELYLGEDILRNADGSLTPVHWRAYIEGVKAYQGEVMDKGTLQKRFEDKVRRARADGESLSSQDWSGLDAIIEELLKTLRGEAETPQNA